jgi:predicted transcriptional regulator
MKTKKTLFPVVLIFSTFFISCKESKNSNEQITEKDTIASRTVKDTIAIKTENVLSDTTGLYKLSNPEAKAYVVKMSEIIFEIEQAMNNNTPNKMPELMKKVNAHQRKQNTIQSSLSESDRILFKVYVNKIADKLDELGTKMSNM